MNNACVMCGHHHQGATMCTAGTTGFCTCDEKPAAKPGEADDEPLFGFDSDVSALYAEHQRLVSKMFDGGPALTDEEARTLQTIRCALDNINEGRRILGLAADHAIAIETQLAEAREEAAMWKRLARGGKG